MVCGLGVQLDLPLTFDITGKCLYDNSMLGTLQVSRHRYASFHYLHSHVQPPTQISTNSHNHTLPLVGKRAIHDCCP